MLGDSSPLKKRQSPLDRATVIVLSIHQITRQPISDGYAQAIAREVLRRMPPDDRQRFMAKADDGGTDAFIEAALAMKGAAAILS